MASSTELGMHGEFKVKWRRARLAPHPSDPNHQPENYEPRRRQCLSR